MAFATNRRSVTGFAAVFAVHALVAVALLRERIFIPVPVAVRYAEPIFIAPPRPIKKPLIVAEPLQKVLPARIPIIPFSPAAVAEAPISPPAEPAAPLDVPEPALDMESLVKQAGRIDRETRPAGENRYYRPSADSMERILSKAFTEARLAVPPKWYEAARIELFSAPNDPAPIYQIQTAFGTFCIFYPDKYKDDGRSRQPRVSRCPVRF